LFCGSAECNVTYTMDGLTIQQVGAYTVVEFHTPSLMDPMKLEDVGASFYHLVDNEDRRWVILDFERVEYVSSQFIGILLTMQKKLAKLPKSKLVVCGVGPWLAELLKITRLDKVLKLRATQKEAVAER
jgi:anti-sigma B factor antagonist